MIASWADVWASEGCADWLINPDGVHANRVGNMVIAHRIFETIAQHASGISLDTREYELGTEWVRDTTRQRADVGDPYRETW